MHVSVWVGGRKGTFNWEITDMEKMEVTQKANMENRSQTDF
jgi:hypothetical protein